LTLIFKLLAILPLRIGDASSRDAENGQSPTRDDGDTDHTTAAGEAQDPVVS